MSLASEKTHSSAQILSSLAKTQAEKQSSYFFYSGPIEINASAENVWKVVKNVADYNRLSKGAVTAYIEGEIAPQKEIILQLCKDKWYGKLFFSSHEMVSVVDNNKNILGWERSLPFSAKTERYQILEKMDENKTRSSITLNVPGPVGLLSKFFFKRIIENSFKSLNEGIKEEAERLSGQQCKSL